VPQSFRFTSSLRTERLEVTLNRARALAPELGISRVTDITRLDCVGVPVFASIRPDAPPGSLCVNAGKGITSDEACVGAYMEAIEYAFAEYNRARLAISFPAAKEVYDGHTRAEAILDFCPVMNTEIDLDAPLACVEASDVCSKEKFLVPAELVFLPCSADLVPNRYFGSNSNGLCSGNTVLEATVHGLAEVIERDICSFQAIRDDSLMVQTSSLPSHLRSIQSALSTVGMNLYLRHLPNMFGIPYFMAAVCESDCQDPIYISVGYGCHPCKDIAATRAVCEALQSRLSFIHGGRDDLIHRYERFRRWSSKARMRYAVNLLLKISRNGQSIRFTELPDHSGVATDLASALDVLVDALVRNGLGHVLRVIYTPPDWPLQVVRILVPGLECFTETTKRVGVRLRNYVRDCV
jgi:ribosomal protein S12 methylthiotransferase accessory factor